MVTSARKELCVYKAISSAYCTVKWCDKYLIQRAVDASFSFLFSGSGAVKKHRCAHTEHEHSQQTSTCLHLMKNLLYLMTLSSQHPPVKACLGVGHMPGLLIHIRVHFPCFMFLWKANVQKTETWCSYFWSPHMRGGSCKCNSRSMAALPRLFTDSLVIQPNKHRMQNLLDNEAL